MEEGIVDLVHAVFSYLRSIPLLYDHHDKLFMIVGLLLAVYFVGSFIRNLLIVTLIIFVLWGFRYQDDGYSGHVNRYTGASCDVGRECWFSERSPRPFDFPSYR